MAHITLVMIMVCVTLTLSVTIATNPGLQLMISHNGLNYAANVAIDLLTTQVKGKTIPDQHGEDHVTIGKVKYDITHMRVTSFTKPHSSLAVRTGHGISWSVTNAGVGINGDWRYEYRGPFGIKIRDHGSFDVSVSGASITVGITMGKSSDGHPTISATSCSSSVSSVSVHFHGGASWLYNLFRHMLANPIKNKLQDVLCTAAKNGINTDAEKALARMKVRVMLKKSPIMIDYSLVTAPQFGSGYVLTNHKGEFFWSHDEHEAPFQPHPMMHPQSTQKMVMICLSDYTINTLGYVLNKHGIMRYVMTHKDMPKTHRGFMNTTCSGGMCIGDLIKQLGQKYPHSAVEISLKTTTSPTLQAQTKDIVGHFNGTVDFNVRFPNNTVHLAFSTHTTFNVSVSVAMRADNITAKVTSLKFHMDVTKSDVGPISDVHLNGMFRLAVNMFIIPKFNEVGAQGFALPHVDVIKFVNAHLYMLQGAVCFGTDAKYSPKYIY